MAPCAKVNIQPLAAPVTDSSSNLASAELASEATALPEKHVAAVSTNASSSTSSQYSTTSVHRGTSFVGLLKQLNTDDGAILPARCVLIRRKAQSSIAFYIEVKPAQAPMRPTAFRKKGACHGIDAGSAGCCRTSLELAARVQMSCLKAHSTRATMLADRRYKLAKQWEEIRYSVLIQRQRDTIKSIYRRTKAQYAQSSAQLKRHLIRCRNVEKWAATVEHAYMVSTTQKLKQFVTLRASLTHTITGMLQHHSRKVIDAHDQEEDVDDTSSIHSKHEAESPFPSFSTALAAHQHVNLVSLRAGCATTSENTTSQPVAEQNSLAPQSVVSNSATSTAPKYILPPPSFTMGDGESPSESLALESTLQSRSSSSLSLDESDKSTLYSRSGSSDIHPCSHKHARYSKRSTIMAHIPLDDSEEEYMCQFADILPPITRFTLRELDLDEILSNAQLRHDLYFDPNLQFKPNTDGERGLAKLVRSKAYWLEVEKEFASGLWLRRLPLLILEIRAIVVELLPYSEGLKEELARVLDVSLIVQQIEYGVLDGGLGLIEYLASLLRANCAPARDPLVDSMVQACKDGDFANTLRICFEVLEYMKLDYANHQLHRLRPYVVENAVSFEWKWFRDQVKAGTVKLDDATKFVRDALERYKTTNVTSSSHGNIPAATALFNEGLIHLISNVSFYNDWQDITIMGALLILFKQAAGPKCTLADISNIKQQLWVLLNDAETSMQHVSLQMISGAGGVRGTALSDDESSLVCAMVDKTLSPKSTLYELLQKRVGLHLLCYLNSGKVDSDSVGKHGLKELEEDIHDLGVRIGKVAEFNRVVYGPIYNALVQGVLDDSSCV
ncbi:hypothetical protein SeMB42_g04437 [Synchytrium endobioticum]|uniref:Uncharacterized protein n=1 Tax=Synchytrium endobioticum TaxID=286115 RepID=A0A507CY14_9FUNG|nr:hypothetical protein SeMB42_g04437 [Synchytrium endobioticum]